MKKAHLTKAAMAAMLAGGTLMTSGCQEIVATSMKEGFFSFLLGQSQNSLDTDLFANFILDVFTGAFGGPAGGSS